MTRTKKVVLQRGQLVVIHNGSHKGKLGVVNSCNNGYYKIKIHIKSSNNSYTIAKRLYEIKPLDKHEFTLWRSVIPEPKTYNDNTPSVVYDRTYDAAKVLISMTNNN